MDEIETMDRRKRLENFAVDFSRKRSHARAAFRMRVRRLLKTADALWFDVLQIVASCGVMFTATAYAVIPAWTLRAFSTIFALWQIATLLLLVALCAALMFRVWHAATRKTPRATIRERYMRELQRVRSFYE